MFTVWLKFRFMFSKNIFWNEAFLYETDNQNIKVKHHRFGSGLYAKLEASFHLAKV